MNRFPRRSLAFVVPALATVLAGCSDGGSSAGGNGPSTGPTYHADIKPLLDAKCNGCHQEGGIAPFALTTYEQASSMKAAIKGAVTAGTMPPWPPADDCTSYLHDRSLTKAQIDHIGQWVDAGAPEGDPNAKPVEVEGNGAGLSRVDVELAIPQPYTPVTSPDEYRCFLVDWPSDSTKYVTGFGVKPGEASIVHHVIAYLATPDQVADFQAMDAADAGEGWTCFGGPGGTRSQWLGGWAPGSMGSDSPPGTGVEVPQGSKVVIQMHYNTSTAKPVPDQTKVVFRVDDKVDKKAYVMPFTDPSWVKNKTMTIPAHTQDVVHSYSVDVSPFIGLITKDTIPSGVPLTIYSAGLHMHTRGTHAETHIERQDGTKECMLDIPKWNFHWQGNYDFKAPKVYQPGDKLSLECHWNNTDATDLNWGEGTGDEMCLGVYYITE
jgi:hypothetical protein